VSDYPDNDIVNRLCHFGLVTGDPIFQEAAAVIARYQVALKKIVEPFPTVFGSAEDMLGDWMSAVQHHKSIARAALASHEKAPASDGQG
jgi:hypothetical protein